MRTVLVCLLAALAVSANAPTPFKGQQSYTYRFDTQVASSLLGASPAEIQQAAATRLRADAQLSFTNERHAKLQLQHIRIGELNGELPKSQRVQPLEHFERKEINPTLKQKLELPLSVSFVDGVVERINFDEDDEAWSKNIKRAVLNMLQLNLKRNDVQGLKMQSSMPPSESEKEAPVFSVPEITLEGECETVYSIQKNQKYGGEDDERSNFNVTKTINFNKCQRTADVTFNYHSTNPSEQLRCLNCIHKQKPQPEPQAMEQIRFSHCQQECQPNVQSKDMERSTFARYELMGKPEKYGVQRVTMLSQYVVKGQNPASQNSIIQVIALSELTFKEQSSEKPVPEFKQSSADETLLYSNEWDVKEKRFYMFGDEESNSPFKRVQQKEQKAAHAVRSMIRQWNDKEQGYELDGALHFMRLVEICRKCSVPELKQIEEAVRAIGKNTQEVQQQHGEEQAASIYRDALAVAATRNTLFVLAEKITKEEIKPVKAAQLLKAFISNQHSPSERQADILERIAKHEVTKQSSALKQTAWLSFSAAVGALCQDKPMQSQKDTFRVEELCPRNKKEQYKKTLVEEWKKAETESIYKQILALKCIGNAALDNTVEELKQIVKEKSQPTLVRMEAIDALRRLRTSMPQQIRQILLPIFQNQREQPEIRMACFSMIMYTQPEKSMVDQLIFTTLNDRSQNVKSFVISALESFAKSPSSAEQEVGNHMLAALKMVKITQEEMRASRRYRVPVYVSTQEETEEQNLFVGLASIVSPSNMIPIHLSASLRSAFNGEATEENMQISLSQKNLEQWYEKIAEFTQRYTESSEEDKQNMQRQSAKDLRQIYSSLGVKSRRAGSYYLDSSEESQESGGQSRKTGENSPFGMICLRFHDVDTTIVPINEQQLPEIVRKMLKGEKPHVSEFDSIIRDLSAGKRFRQHLAWTMGEKKIKLPTTAGLPLCLQRQTSLVGSVEGELKAALVSEQLENSRGLTAELKLRSSGIATHQHKAECWTPIVSTGIDSTRTVEVNAPLDVKLRLSNEKVEIKMRPPQDHRQKIVAVHTLPVTYIRQYNIQTENHGEPRVKTIHNWALEHTQREQHVESQQGKLIQIEGHYHQLKNMKQILQALYTTENSVHVYYKPNERAPKELTLRISGSAFQSHDQHSGPEMDSFYSSSSKRFNPIFETEDEGLDFESGEQRRSKLSSFSQRYTPVGSQKHMLKIEAEARCNDRTHKVMAEIKGGCDNKLQHCKIFVDAERTPFSSESQPWTLNAKLQTVMPESVRDQEEDLSQKQSRMLVQMDSKWGSGRESRLDVRIQAEPTKKTYWKNAAATGSSQNWTPFLNKIDMVAEYQLPQQTKYMVQRAFELLKAKMFWQLNTQERQNEKDVVRATVVIDPITRRHANVSVQTPTERLRAETVELPTRISPYSLQGRRQSSSVRSFGQLINQVSNFGGAECRADERRIKTFDGVSYRAPMSNCWQVLAKDCSREEPRFVVLMKKSEEQKKVKIMTPNSVIELSKQSQSSKPIVKINGQQVESEEELADEGVETSYNKVYVSKNGVNVEFDGEEAKIKVGGMYKNIQCGLCGHYNDEENDDFRMSDNRQSGSLKQFHRSYTLMNEECSESNRNAFYNQQGSSEFEMIRRPSNTNKHQRQMRGGDNSQQNFGTSSSESNESGWGSQSQEQGNKRGPQPVERTQVIEYNHKLCFSLNPVKKCPNGSAPDEDAQTQEKKVQFFCLDRATTEARQMLRQVRNGRLVDAEGRTPSFVEEVRQPTRCVEAY